MRIAGLILTFGLACTQFAVGEITWRSTTHQQYHFTVTNEDVAKTPIWRDGTDHPPLSARQALALAKQKLVELVGKETQWRLHNLSLEPWRNGGHWIYVACYRQHREPETPGE